MPGGPLPREGADAEMSFGDRLKKQVGALEGSPPRLVFRETRVLALDQSLANTGWVLLETGGDSVRVVFKGTLRPKSQSLSHEGTYEKAASLEAMLEQVALKCLPLLSSDFVVVMERPSVRGYRVESALMAGREVYRMSHRLVGSDPVMVSNLTMRKTFGLKAKDPKAKVKEALVPYVPEVGGREWNEHMRDALALGLAAVRRTDG